MKKLGLFIMLLLIFVGCNNKSKDEVKEKIYGEWLSDVVDNDQMLFEFNEDNSFRWYQDSSNLNQNYIYGTFTLCYGDEAMEKSGISSEEFLNLKSGYTYLTKNHIFYIELEVEGTYYTEDNIVENIYTIPFSFQCDEDYNLLYGANLNTLSTYYLTRK